MLAYFPPNTFKIKCLIKHQGKKNPEKPNVSFSIDFRFSSALKGKQKTCKQLKVQFCNPTRRKWRNMSPKKKNEAMLLNPRSMHQIPENLKTPGRKNLRVELDPETAKEKKNVDPERNETSIHEKKKEKKKKK